MNKTSWLSVLLVAIGISVLIFYFIKEQNISQYQMDDTSVTVIELTGDYKIFDLTAIVGVIALTLGAFLGIKKFIVGKKENLKRPEDDLTAKEKSVLDLIKAGKTNKEIAEELGISLSTVKTHINNIYKKLGVSSREDILKKA